jgi:hypothetical protein
LSVAEQDRLDIAAKRRRWRVCSAKIDLVRFVFLDETGAATNMARRGARGLSDRRLVDLLSRR